MKSLNKKKSLHNNKDNKIIKIVKVKVIPKI